LFRWHWKWHSGFCLQNHANFTGFDQAALNKKWDTSSRSNLDKPTYLHFQVTGFSSSFCVVKCFQKSHCADLCLNTNISKYFAPVQEKTQTRRLHPVSPNQRFSRHLVNLHSLTQQRNYKGKMSPTCNQLGIFIYLPNLISLLASRMVPEMPEDQLVAMMFFLLPQIWVTVFFYVYRLNFVHHVWEWIKRERNICDYSSSLEKWVRNSHSHHFTTGSLSLGTLPACRTTLTCDTALCFKQISSQNQNIWCWLYRSTLHN